jgi:hypothetical protein
MASQDTRPREEGVVTVTSRNPKTQRTDSNKQYISQVRRLSRSGRVALSSRSSPSLLVAFLLYSPPFSAFALASNNVFPHACAFSRMRSAQRAAPAGPPPPDFVGGCVFATKRSSVSSKLRRERQRAQASAQASAEELTQQPLPQLELPPLLPLKASAEELTQQPLDNFTHQVSSS